MKPQRNKQTITRRTGVERLFQTESCAGLDGVVADDDFALPHRNGCGAVVE